MENLLKKEPSKYWELAKRLDISGVYVSNIIRKSKNTSDKNKYYLILLLFRIISNVDDNFIEFFFDDANFNGNALKQVKKKEIEEYLKENNACYQKSDLDLIIFYLERLSTLTPRDGGDIRLYELISNLKNLVK